MIRWDSNTFVFNTFVNPLRFLDFFYTIGKGFELVYSDFLFVYATECLFARENDRIINGFVKGRFSVLKRKTEKKQIFFYRIPLKFPHSPISRLWQIFFCFAVQVIAKRKFVHSGNFKCLDIPAILSAWTFR